MNEPHILLFSAEYPPNYRGGLGIHVHQLARGLVQTGHRVSVATFHPGESSVTDDRGVSVHALTPHHSGADLRRGLTPEVKAFNHDLSEYLEKAFGAAPPDLIHCHDYFLFGGARDFATRQQVPLIGTIHLLDEPCMRWWTLTPSEQNMLWEKEYMRGLDAVITVSYAMAELIRTHHGVGDRLLQVIHNGIDTQRFAPDKLAPAVRQKLRATMAQPGDHIVLFAGRLTPMKGLNTFFAAADLLLKTHPQTRFLIAGEAYSRESNQKVKTLQKQFPLVNQRLHLLGKISQQKLALLYQAADLAVFPSVFEPFGFVVAEALASGIPVVATCVGGIPEIVEDGHTGLLVPVIEGPDGLRGADIPALAEAQRRMLDEPERARAMARAGSEHVRQTFTSANMVRQTGDFYRCCLAPV